MLQEEPHSFVHSLAVNWFSRAFSLFHTANMSTQTEHIAIKLLFIFVFASYSSHRHRHPLCPQILTPFFSMCSLNALKFVAHCCCFSFVSKSHFCFIYETIHQNSIRSGVAVHIRSFKCYEVVLYICPSINCCIQLYSLLMSKTGSEENSFTRTMREMILQFSLFAVFLLHHDSWFTSIYSFSYEFVVQFLRSNAKFSIVCELNWSKSVLFEPKITFRRGKEEILPFSLVN